MKRSQRHTQRKNKRQNKKQLSFLEALRLFAEMPVYRF